MKHIPSLLALVLMIAFIGAGLTTAQPGRKRPRPWEDDFNPGNRVRLPPERNPPDFEMPNTRPPNQHAPRENITIWRCGRCNAELARDGAKPVNLRTCPKCGVAFRDMPGDGILRAQMAMDDMLTVASFLERWGLTIGLSCTAALAFIVISFVSFIIVRLRKSKTTAKPRSPDIVTVEAPSRGAKRF